MEIVFFILIAVLGYDVQGLKVRAVRRRWIQYQPSNQIFTPEQIQYYRWLSQNQRPPIYRNGKLIYSYLDPDGVRFNMFGGPERYKAYLKKYGQMGYQSVDQYGAGFGIKGAEGQSGQTGYAGQSGYQRWINSGGGEPVRLVGYNGINGYGGQYGQSVYQGWQDSGSSRPVGVSQGFNGLNGYGEHGEQSFYHGYGSRNPEVSIEQSGMKPGHIDQTMFESWQNIAPEGQLGVSIEQHGVNSRSKGHIGETFQNSESIEPIDVAVGHSGVSSGHGESVLNLENPVDQGESVQNHGFSQNKDQPVYLGLQNPASNHIGVGESEIHYVKTDPIGQSVYQTLQIPASIKPIDLGESGLNYEHSQNIDQSVYQGLQNPTSISPIGVRESEINHGDSQNIDQSVYFVGQNPANISPVVVGESYLSDGYGQSVGQSESDLQNTGSGNPLVISLEQIEPVHVSQSLFTSQNSAPGSLVDLPAEQNILFTENKYQPVELIAHKLENSGDEGQIIVPVNQHVSNAGYYSEQSLPDSGQINYVVHDNGEHSQDGYHETLPIATGEKNKGHDIEENIDPNQYNTESDLSYSIVNKPDVAPQVVLEDFNINDVQNVSPTGIETDHHIVSPGDERIIFVDKTKLTDQTPVQEIHVSGEENVPIRPIVPEASEGEFYADQSKLNLHDQSPLINNGVGINVNEQGNPDAVMFASENDIPSSNGDILPIVVPDNQDNRAPISIGPESDLIPPKNEEINTAVKDKSIEVIKIPVMEIFDEKDTNNDEDIAPVPIALSNAPTAPVTDFPSLQQTNLNGANKVADAAGETYKINEKEPNLLYSYILNPKQEQNYGYVTNLNPVTRQRQPVVIPFYTQSGNVPRMRPATGDILQENNVIKSGCDSSDTNVNVISENKKSQDFINNLQSKGIYYYPPNTYKNIETLQNTNKLYHFNNFQRTNDAYRKGDANPIFYKKEMLSYYRPGNIYLNAFNVPYPNYHVPTHTPTEPKEISINSEVLGPTESPSSSLIFEGNEELRPSDSELVHIKAKVLQNHPINYDPDPAKPASSTFERFAKFNTGFDSPSKPTLDEYVNEIQEALGTDLIKLYHSKCSTGHDTKLIKAFKKLIDLIKLEHCQVT